MASDIKNTGEDVDMAECDEEKVVTMMDVLQEQEDFEEDANAVLGASDEKECTYSKGYIKRQAIYACLTCCSEAKSDPTKRAGVCLACSLMCHENHELIELYTKRNFRCDCGNPKFNSHPCTFISSKTDFNEDNSYNQNFSGLYCTCQRPYPDPESTVEDEMIQCIVCEDWLHASHLDSPLPTNNQYSEMICRTCMEKNEFLHDYSSLAVNTESADVDVVNVNGVENNLSSISNSEAKAEENTDSTSITNGSKCDVEMTEEKLETSTTSETNTPITDTKDSEVDLKDATKENDESNDKTVIENENNVEAVIEKEKNNDTVIENENKEETITEKEKNNENVIENEKQDMTLSANETDTNEPSDTVSEQVTSGTTQEKSTNMGENENTDDQEKASEDIETNSNSAQSSNSDETNKESKKIDEQINEETNSDIKVNNEAKTNSESKDENKQILDEEKMEEDRLLAEPEDDNVTKNIEPTPIEKNSENKPTDTEISNKMSEEEGTKSEATEPTDKAENDTIVDENKKEDEPNLDNNSKSDETTGIATNDSVSIENAEVQLEKESDNTSADTSVTIDNNKEPISPEKISEKRKLEDENSDTLEAKKPKIDACVRPKAVKKIYNGATFWPSNFRQKLCTCQECISMYKDLSVLFLTDPEDTVSAYESLGKEKFNGQPATQYEKGMQALSSLDRIQQINALTEYNRMRDKLLDFLKSFKEKQEIVKEEDIKAFFAGMKPKKESDGVYFCR